METMNFPILNGTGAKPCFQAGKRYFKNKHEVEFNSAGHFDGWKKLRDEWQRITMSAEESSFANVQAAIGREHELVKPGQILANRGWAAAQKTEHSAT